MSTSPCCHDVSRCAVICDYSSISKAGGRRHLLESVVISSEAMFQVAILQKRFPQKLGELTLELKCSMDFHFWTGGQWFLEGELMMGLSKDFSDLGAESGDSLLQLAVKATRRPNASPVQQRAAARILHTLENAADISKVPDDYWLPAQEVFIEAIRQNCFSIVVHLSQAAAIGRDMLTCGLQHAVKVGNDRAVDLLLDRKADALSSSSLHSRLFLLGLAEMKGFTEIAKMLRSHIRSQRSCSAAGLGKLLSRHLVRMVLDFLYTEEREYGTHRATQLLQDDIERHKVLADEGLLLHAGHAVEVKRGGRYVPAEVVAWHPSRQAVKEHYVVKLVGTGREYQVPFSSPGFEDSIRSLSS
eukprot:TRINITY_DN26716_c0_g1_i1.p1 TRINITY_DN26716_c0_g1~~TRINITY_DN26716_c0_g1_i1.p1  ORF type:complete len:373 (+),score=72.29 TRINITY_DN26716_c0_g1_i1:47-1120(+)